ncbi:MAG: hypothetical protein AAF193_11685, partial [Bacteroidota bacterium]
VNKSYDLTTYSGALWAKLGFNLMTNHNRAGWSFFTSIGVLKQLLIIDNGSTCEEWRRSSVTYPNNYFPSESSFSSNSCEVNYEDGKWFMTMMRFGMEITFKLNPRHEIGLISSLEVRSLRESYDSTAFGYANIGLSFNWLQPTTFKVRKEKSKAKPQS